MPHRNAAPDQAAQQHLPVKPPQQGIHAEHDCHTDGNDQRQAQHLAQHVAVFSHKGCPLSVLPGLQGRNAGRLRAAQWLLK